MSEWQHKFVKTNVRDCGHWTQQEQPDEVNRLIIEFLRDIAGRVPCWPLQLQLQPQQ